MPEVQSNDSLLPPRRRRRLYAGSFDTRPRSFEDLLADVLYGAYWHNDYYRDLPPELQPWESALATSVSDTAGRS